MDKKGNYDLAKEILNPFLKSYLQQLLDELEAEKIIKKAAPKKDSSQKYELVRAIKNRTETVIPNVPEPRMNEDFKEFKKNMKNVYSNMRFSRSENTHNIPFFKLIEELIEHKILGIPDYDKTPLKEILSLEDRDLDDAEVAKRIERVFIENKLNFKEYSISVITIFIKQKVFEYLNHFDISEAPKPFLERPFEIDFLAKSEGRSTPELLFEIKFRNAASDGLREIIYQSFELLKNYESLTDSKARIVIILVADDNYGNFDKLNFKFKQDLSELFPGYTDKITLIPVDKLNLHQFSRDLNKINFYDDILFNDSPKVVTAAKDFYANADLLKSDTGTISVWVKLKPLKAYYDKDMNFEYVVSHASNGYRSVAGDYPDVFSLSLASNKTGKITSNASTFYWRFWISNGQRDNFYLKGPDLAENSSDSWHHIVVRWDHRKPLIELIINNVIRQQDSNSYLKFWPATFLDKLTVGTWGNKAEVHYIKLPLYRLITISKYLDDEWIKIEWNNSPQS